MYIRLILALSLLPLSTLASGESDPSTVRVEAGDNHSGGGGCRMGLSGEADQDSVATPQEQKCQEKSRKGDRELPGFLSE